MATIEWVESLRRVVEFGRAHGKQNVIVSLKDLEKLLALKTEPEIRRRMEMMLNALASQCNCVAEGGQHAAMCKAGGQMIQSGLFELRWVLGENPDAERMQAQIEEWQRAAAEQKGPEGQ